MVAIPQVTTYTEEFPSDKIVSLVVDAQMLGTLRIVGDAAHNATIMCSGDGHLLPDYIELREGELHIDCHNTRNYLKYGQQQRIEIVAHVPAATDIIVRMTAGTITLNGTTGAVDIDGQVGEISGEINAERVNIRLWIGEVALNQLHKDAEMQIGIGSITLEWDALYGVEHIEARSMFGGIDLRLPADFKQVRAAGSSIQAEVEAAPASLVSQLW
jgi:hypothetical protein